MVGRIYRPDYFPGGTVSVPMTQLSAVTVAYAQYYDPSGTLQPILGGQTSATSPYAIQIGGAAQTTVHAYTAATRPFVNIARPIDGTGTGVGGDNDVFEGNATNEMVIWDERTTDAGAQPQLFGASRYGLPGLSGGDSGVMSQTRAIDVFDMGGGNDLVSLIYNSGNFGGPGIAYTANATIYGGAGTDWVWSGAGNDLIFGGDDNDTLFGGNGDDTIYGGAGVDTIQGGPGADIMFGGGNGDWVSYVNSSAGVNLFLTFDITVVQAGGDAVNDHMTGFDNAIGSMFNDIIS